MNWLDFREIMDGIVHDSNVIYRDLVFGNEHFYDYFEASPIKGVSSLNIGPRPQRLVRLLPRFLVFVRIPWVFSYHKTRIGSQVGMVWFAFNRFYPSWLATLRNFNICLKHGHSSVHFCQTWTWCFSKSTHECRLPLCTIGREEEVRSVFNTILMSGTD